MNKKVGKFKVWQLVAVGVAIGVIYYIYTKNSGETTEPEYGYLSGTEGGEAEPSGTGGASSGSGTGSGIAETLGVLEALRNAGLIPERGETGSPEREVIETETPGPEPKTNQEVKAARLATQAARKTEHKAVVAEQKAKAAAKKLENKTVQKNNSTGGSASVPNTHTTPAHPANKIGNAKKVAAANTKKNTPDKIGNNKKAK